MTKLISYGSSKNKLQKLWEATDEDLANLKRIPKEKVIINGEQFFKITNTIPLLQDEVPNLSNQSLLAADYLFEFKKFPQDMIAQIRIVAIVKPIGNWEIVTRGSENSNNQASVGQFISYAFQAIDDENYNLQINIAANLQNQFTSEQVPFRFDLFAYLTNRNKFVEIQSKKK